MASINDVIKLEVLKYPPEGYLRHTYSPLKILLKGDDKSIDDFNVSADKLNISSKSSFNIECQPSYDGTVNLILNDDVNPPRIINTRFTKKENDTYKIINRNQIIQTNLYDEENLDSQTRLIKNSNFFPKIDLLYVDDGGCLKGGNYTLYLKYIDGDFNESPVMCESGQISIFHGEGPDAIGTLSDEMTSKQFTCMFSNLDISYNAFKLYVIREYSDTNGSRLKEGYVLDENYVFSNKTMELTINGFEVSSPINPDDINVQYLSVNHAKTQAQVQNMLFFGNVGSTVKNEAELQNCAYFIEVMLSQGENVGWVNDDYTYKSNYEYYNSENIYYRVGYWPDEYYRLGVVFIMNDDTTTPAFPLRGCAFQSFYDDYKDDSTRRYNGASNMRSYPNIPTKFISDSENKTVLERNSLLIKDKYAINTFGVFKTPKETSGDLNGQRKHIIIDSDTKEVKPFYFRITIPNIIKSELSKLGVKGLFFVRQKRIPTILGQGVALAIDESSYSPMLKYGDKYVTESFLIRSKNNWTEKPSYEGLELPTNTVNKRKLILKQPFQFNESLIYADSSRKKSSCLISVEANISPTLQSTLNGESFVLEDAGSGSLLRDNRMFFIKNQIKRQENKEATSYSLPCVYVNSETPYKFIYDYGFSTKFGSQESTKDVSFFGKEIRNNDNDELESGAYHYTNQNIIRGIYTDIIGVCGNVTDNTRYNIRIPGYSDAKFLDYFTIRKNDNSEFFAVSDRYLISQINESKVIDIYRGDCYSNTVTVRLLRNFQDSDTPINDTIVDVNTWNKNYTGFLKMGNATEDKVPTGDWTLINKSDLNAVNLGMWLTYKCLSSYNLGLRSPDHSYPDEEALVGNPRSFYPASGMNYTSSNNIPESKILNLGYSSTVGSQSYLLAKELPYTKELFDNRIIFSNVQVEDEFRNGYRVFQGLSYKDIDRQYGAIVKLLPWKTDLLCVFEHGVAIIPVNQKALMSTTTGQSIHLYGAGVLQSQVSLITGDYGSVWQESIIRTPIGVYGVDTYAKKIWRYSESKGFETISDMVIQRFLNDHILLKERTSTPDLGLRNVKTHYNNYKGDVMFTFYNYDKGEEWNLCYNERLGKWTTRYSWIPLYSENINNIYYSFDKHRAEALYQIGNLLNDDYGLKCTNGNLYYNILDNGAPTNIDCTFELTNNLKNTKFIMDVESAETSYFDKSGSEVTIKFNKEELEYNGFPQIITKEDGYGTNVDFKCDLAALVGWFEKNEIDMGMKCPLWIKFNVVVNCYYGDPNRATGEIKGVDRHYVLCFMVNSKEGKLKDSTSAERIAYDKMFINGVYVHGRAGIFDEIDYTDDELDNQILPTKWYDKQEPFEFEFVVNDPIGMHKVFENLMIVSNNVAPEEIQFEIEGDAYSMWRTMDGVYNRDKKKEQYKNNTLFQNASMKWDTILNQYSILMSQECKSIEKFGRRLGNMHYKEDAWYITIDPLLLNKNGKTVSTKLRDKYLKVRVRYSGTDLAVITAIKTSMNLSHS